MANLAEAAQVVATWAAPSPTAGVEGEVAVVEKQILGKSAPHFLNKVFDAT